MKYFLLFLNLPKNANNKVWKKGLKLKATTALCSNKHTLNGVYSEFI